MRMTHKTLLERLDDVANWTGVPRLARYPARRRSMRWLPIALLTLEAVGAAIALVAAGAAYWLGYGLIMAGFSVSVLLPLKGPVKPLGAPDGADERERDVRRRAFLVTFAVIAGLAVLALFLLPALALIGQWSLDLLSRRAIAAGLALIALFNTLPTLYASWASRPLAADEEE